MPRSLDEGQGHFGKLIILTMNTKFFCYDQLMILKCSSRLRSPQGQGHIKVKVIQSYLRSRPHKVRSFKFKVTQGQGHHKVTVILRSMPFWDHTVMCFDFYPRAGGWLSSECLSLLVSSVGQIKY